VRHLGDTRDQRRQVEIAVAAACRIQDRAGHAIDVLRAAAQADPDIAALWDTARRQRRRDVRVVTALLTATGPSTDLRGKEVVTSFTRSPAPSCTTCSSATAAGGATGSNAGWSTQSCSSLSAVRRTDAPAPGRPTAQSTGAQHVGRGGGPGHGSAGAADLDISSTSPGTLCDVTDDALLG